MTQFYDRTSPLSKLRILYETADAPHMSRMNQAGPTLATLIHQDPAFCDAVGEMVGRVANETVLES